MATRRRAERPEKYVAALHAARRQLSAAREGLARTTTPDGAVSYVDPKLRWAQQLLEERRDELLRHPNVIGVALGSKYTGGVDTDVLCLTVFVSRKLKPESLEKRGRAPLPRRLHKGKRTLEVDVVPMGRLNRQAFAGQSCSVTSGVTRTGTIGAPAVDLGGGAPVFITAMHVTGMTELTASSSVTVSVKAPSILDQSAAPIIGRVMEGTRRGIDAAKVLLASPHSVSREIPGGIGFIRGWRPLAFPGDRNIPVTMFGAVSRIRHSGLIEHPAAFLDRFGLDSAITVRGLATIEGDSGAALLDRDRFVLGFLVGAVTDGARIFCPASLVLQRLRCDIPTILQ
jgi:hypothetical protein